MSPLSISHIILFLKDPLKSGEFYKNLIGLDPIESPPTFVLLSFQNNLMLGLWSKKTATPKVTTLGGGCEICFSKNSVQEVQDTYDDWLARDIKIAQPPLAMDGMSLCFLAHDLDGHRIRVLTFGE